MNIIVFDIMNNGWPKDYARHVTVMSMLNTRY